MSNRVGILTDWEHGIIVMFPVWERGTRRSSDQVDSKRYEVMKNKKILLRKTEKRSQMENDQKGRA